MAPGRRPNSLPMTATGSPGLNLTKFGSWRLSNSEIAGLLSSSVAWLSAKPAEQTSAALAGTEEVKEVIRVRRVREVRGGGGAHPACNVRRTRSRNLKQEWFSPHTEFSGGAGWEDGQGGEQCMIGQNRKKRVENAAARPDPPPPKPPQHRAGRETVTPSNCVVICPAAQYPHERLH